MDTQTLINALLEWAEWWGDETGFINCPTLWENSVQVTEDDYGRNLTAENKLMALGGLTSAFQAHAWFLLLIIADLEYTFEDYLNDNSDM